MYRISTPFKLSLLAGAIVLFGAACSSTSTTPESTVAATVNGRKIMLAEVERILGDRMTDLDRLEGLTVSATLAYVATLIEGASWEGLDNLFLPVALYLLLEGFLRMNAAEVALLPAASLVVASPVTAFASPVTALASPVVAVCAPSTCSVAAAAGSSAACSVATRSPCASS